MAALRQKGSGSSDSKSLNSRKRLTLRFDGWYRSLDPPVFQCRIVAEATNARSNRVGRISSGLLWDSRLSRRSRKRARTARGDVRHLNVIEVTAPQPPVSFAGARPRLRCAHREVPPSS